MKTLILMSHGRPERFNPPQLGKLGRAQAFSTAHLLWGSGVKADAFIYPGGCIPAQQTALIAAKTLAGLMPRFQGAAKNEDVLELPLNEVNWLQEVHGADLSVKLRELHPDCSTVCFVVPQSFIRQLYTAIDSKVNVGLKASDGDLNGPDRYSGHAAYLAFNVDSWVDINGSNLNSTFVAEPGEYYPEDTRFAAALTAFCPPVSLT